MARHEVQVVPCIWEGIDDAMRWRVFWKEEMGECVNLTDEETSGFTLENPHEIEKFWA